jgi:hypothetical protein
MKLQCIELGMQEELVVLRLMPFHFLLAKFNALQLHLQTTAEIV